MSVRLWQTFLKLKPEISITFLGTGTSTGVPVIGCSCKVCTSNDPKLTRTRSSLHIQTPEKSILIDSGPDLREQALRENLTQVDAVLYTHAHLDHITGFDELRAFCWHTDTPIPLYGSPALLTELKRIFSWAFLPSNQYKGYIKPNPIETHGSFTLGATTITPIPVIHGSVETQGYRFDHPGAPSFAYIPDVKTIPESSSQLLQGVSHLIIDSLHMREHPTHMNLPEALAAGEHHSVDHLYLTHLSHELDIEATTPTLPSHVQLAFDGMQLSFAL